jgi:hypothetical protein
MLVRLHKYVLIDKPNTDLKKQLCEYILPSDAPLTKSESVRQTDGQFAKVIKFDDLCVRMNLSERELVKILS